MTAVWVIFLPTAAEGFFLTAGFGAVVFFVACAFFADAPAPSDRFVAIAGSFRCHRRPVPAHAGHGERSTVPEPKVVLGRCPAALHHQTDRRLMPRATHIRCRAPGQARFAGWRRLRA